MSPFSPREEAELTRAIFVVCAVIATGILLFLVADTLVSSRVWFQPPAASTSARPVG